MSFLGDMRLTGFLVTRIILVKADDSRAFAEKQGYNIVFRYAPYCGASGGVVCEPQIG